MWAPSVVQPLRPFALRQTVDATLAARSSGSRQACRQYHALPKTPTRRATNNDSVAIATTRTGHGGGGNNNNRRGGPERDNNRSTSILMMAGGLGLAASVASWQSRALYCEPVDEARACARDAKRNFSNGSSDDQGRDPMSGEYPKSDVNIYNLGFGTICGVCAGVFIKKGAKLLAFLLGGGFILLQYLNTQRIIKIDWRAMGRRYDNVVNSAAGDGQIAQTAGWRDSKAARLWSRFTHFLTADFPSRGTFLAGLVLGLRLG